MPGRYTNPDNRIADIAIIAKVFVIIGFDIKVLSKPFAKESDQGFTMALTLLNKEITGNGEDLGKVISFLYFRSWLYMSIKYRNNKYIIFYIKINENYFKYFDWCCNIVYFPW